MHRISNIITLFLAAWLVFVPAVAAQTAQTPQPMRGTIQLKGGPVSSMPLLLMRRQPFIDETNGDLWVGFSTENRRLTWRWIFGSGAPSAVQGLPGDCYLNTSTNEVYQKAANGWVWKANFTGAQGVAGMPGASITGPPGSNGIDGKSATISIGSVSVGVVGSQPIITQRGTISAAIFDFVFPAPAKGDRGAQGQQGLQGVPGQSIIGPSGKDGITPTFSYGTTTTLPAGNPAAGTLTGSGPSYTLNLSLPVGATGATGATGPAGQSIVGPSGTAGKDGTNALPLFRTARATLPAIALGVTTTITLTWTYQGATNPFSDTNYTVSGPGVVGASVNVSYRITGLSATGATVTVTAVSLVPAGSATIHLVAIHD